MTDTIRCPRRYWYIGPDNGLLGRRCVVLRRTDRNGHRLVMFRGAHYAIVHRTSLRPSHPVPDGRAAGYPINWPEIATIVKAAAGWKCEHCGHIDDPDAGYGLTVHHIDDDKSHNDYCNLVALCQRCHLHWQAKFTPGQVVMDFARPVWMRRRGLGAPIAKGDSL